jgi:hypothetical protein
VLLFGAAKGLLTLLRSTVVPQAFGDAQPGRIGGAMGAISLLSHAQRHWWRPCCCVDARI